MCPNYEILNISDWSMDKNDLFIKYIAKQKRQNIDLNLPVCPLFPIKIYLNNSQVPKHNLVKKGGKLLLKKYGSEYAPGSITSRELCLLIHLKFNFFAIEEDKIFKDFVLVSKKSKKYIQNIYKKSNINIIKIN